MSTAYYNELYTNNKQYFGDHPDNLLRNYYSLCDKKGRVLDVGIGQGRNARFLIKQGYGVDGIDTSSVAIGNIKEWIDKDSLDLRLFNSSFEDYSCPTRFYSAIMIFGVFPVLSIGQIQSLAQKARHWLRKKGIIFITGFTTNEIAFHPTTGNWNEISNNEYADNDGNFRTFMDVENVISKFRRFKIIYQWEGFGERHTHGTDQVEQHHMYELILQKL